MAPPPLKRHEICDDKFMTLAASLLSFAFLLIPNVGTSFPVLKYESEGASLSGTIKASLSQALLIMRALRQVIDRKWHGFLCLLPQSASKRMR
jgi:hypothetical protein